MADVTDLMMEGIRAASGQEVILRHVGSPVAWSAQAAPGPRHHSAWATGSTAVEALRSLAVTVAELATVQGRPGVAEELHELLYPEEAGV